MLNVPNLPTDNLYKFMALAGLTLLVLSTVLPRLQLAATWDKMDQVDIDRAAVAAEGRNLERDLKYVDHLSAHERELLEQRSRENVIHSATNLARSTIMQRLTRDLDSWNLVQLIGGLGGTLLTAFGFALWYTRVQVHQDALLRSQAKDAKP